MAGYGQKSHLGIVFQNSFGDVGSVNSIHFIPFLSEDLGLTIPPMYSEAIRGVFDEGDSYEGPRTVAGTVTVEAQAIPLGAMFKSILDEKSIVTSGSLYTRTFEPRVSDFDSVSANNPVTLYVYRDVGSAFIYSDMNGATLELSIANGEFLTAKVSYVGGTFAQNAAVAASLPTGKRWTWNVASVSLAGTATPNLVNATITVDDGGLEAQHTLNNSKYPSRIKRTAFRNVAVSAALKFDNQDEYQQFISQSEREMIIHLEGITAVQSGYNETLTIKLPLMRYEETKPAVGGPGQIEMSVTGRGKYSVTSATALQFILANGQASY